MTDTSSAGSTQHYGCEEEALLDNVFAALELDEDVLHRIVTSVIEDLIERGELDGQKGAN